MVIPAGRPVLCRRPARVVLALVLAPLSGAALYTAAATRRAEIAFPPRGRFVDVGGPGAPVRLHVRDPGRGVPVVLLHGNPGFLQDFAPDDTAGLFTMLARSYRVLAVDRPGHGYSDRPSTAGVVPAEQARLLHAALGRLGVEQPILVGHSWGGALALTYALAYPGAVRGLVLVGTRAYPHPSDGGALYAALRAPVVGPLLAHTLMRPFGGRVLDAGLAGAYAPDPVPPDHRASARALWLRPGQVAATVWDTRLLNEALRTTSGAYGRLAMPVVILVGDRDGGRAESRRLAGEVPGAELAVVDGVGHHLPRARPAAIVTAVGRVAARAAVRGTP